MHRLHIVIQAHIEFCVFVSKLNFIQCKTSGAKFPDSDFLQGPWVSKYSLVWKHGHLKEIVTVAVCDGVGRSLRHSDAEIQFAPSRRDRNSGPE